ncbi:UPF0496 protein At3g49070 isoform X1 [Nicotiana sylvestris]|uniref:UPF0496 protein At3g49070-like isoform X1 n=1 Tax=Nicotiana sylvestris TaxID=4096 RepID=A0A1U7YCD1_NICSY|nr:PREDICTED: UPF0496 protein At3g49070-like isoform X1 [Nicotiana sylvestris]
MKIKFRPALRKYFAWNEAQSEKPAHVELDLREEYAHAFRTESYADFWTRVLALGEKITSPTKIVGSTSAARLPSYRLFVEHLLDPDQPTVTRILALIQTHPQTYSLLSEYFSQTAEASLLCSVLLKKVESTRSKYKSLKFTLDSLQKTPYSHVDPMPKILTRLAKFCNSLNPFVSSASSSIQFHAVQANCSQLLKQLELRRDKTRAKLRLMNKLKRGSAVFLVALTVSLTIIVATHALALLVAAPIVMAASFQFASSKKLASWSAQLDIAAKGTYILIRDLDTISRLVGRLTDELEDLQAIVRFWLERGGDPVQLQLQASGEVARQLKKNYASFAEQLDELEEHLYLCFMTINRARNLVITEIMNSGHPNSAPYLLPKE